MKQPFFKTHKRLKNDKSLSSQSSKGDPDRQKVSQDDSRRFADAIRQIKKINKKDASDDKQVVPVQPQMLSEVVEESKSERLSD